MFHFGKNNGVSINGLFIIRLICLITIKRKLIIIIFRIVGFVFNWEILW